MIPGVHYPENENWNYPKRRTKCPHCGHEHKADITFYKECVNCHKTMTDVTIKNKDREKYYGF